MRLDEAVRLLVRAYLDRKQRRAWKRVVSL